MTRAGRSLVGIRELTAEEIVEILDRAVALRQAARDNGPLGLLRGRTVALLFMEPSTRTRFSFEMAVRTLGADAMVFGAAGSSTAKGESLLDTARTLRSIGVDVFVLRHKRVGAPHLLARRLDAPVINAGDGIDEHPTQALLDALTLRDRLGDLARRTVAIVGDVRHSRVARSNCFLLTRLGARVLMAGPGTLCPPGMAALGIEVVPDLDRAVEQADAVMMLRIQRERLGRAMIPSDREYARLFGLDAARLAGARPGTLVMHPAPMNRGVEITDEVADGSASVVFDQIANGVAVRMACIERAVGVA